MKYYYKNDSPAKKKKSTVRMTNDGMVWFDDEPARKDIPVKRPKDATKGTARKGGRRGLSGRGLTNGTGLINGNGLVNGNGLINGNGMANLKGLTRGGLINGNGITNGNGLLKYYYLRKKGPHVSHAERKRLTNIYLMKQRRRREAIGAAAFVTAILLVPVLLYFFSIGGTEGIKIDGEFGDWKEVEKRESAITLNVNPNVDIVGAKCHRGSGQLDLYVRVQGVMFAGGGGGTDVLEIFLDTDGDPGTGYGVGGIGADRLVHTYGAGGKAISSTLMGYDDGRDPRGLDINAFRPCGNAWAAVRGSELELQVPLFDIQSAGQGPISAYIVSRASDGTKDRSDLVISDRPGLLLIEQEGPGKKVLNREPYKDLLVLKATSFDRDTTVSELVLEKRGSAHIGSISYKGTSYPVIGGNVTIPLQPPLVVKRGETRSLEFSADTTTTPAGGSIGLRVRSVRDVWCDAAVTLRGGMTDWVGYVQGAPPGVVIDGAFGDWSPNKKDPAGDVLDPGTDIRDHGSYRSGESMSFYMSVEGAMMAGEEVPAQNPLLPGPATEPGTTPAVPQPATPLPRSPGMDASRIFLDLDGSALTGYAISGIGADCMAEVLGKSGEVLEQGLLKFSGPTPYSWNWTPTGPLSAFCDAKQLEVGIVTSALSIPAKSTMKAVYWTTDWTGAKDTIDAFPVPPGTRSPAPDYNYRTGDGTYLKTSAMTQEDLQRFKQTAGVWQPNINYTPLVEGYGTGLMPPTDADWDRIASDMYEVEDVAPMGGTLNTSKDNSASIYFPPIGSQGAEGSCVAWATGYYTKTFQEAKEHGWNLSGASWTGGYSGAPTSSYQDRIMSPDFIYHQINKGGDNGAYYSSAMNLCNRTGICTWTKMPYSDSDHTTWPTETAWREAPLYRTATGYGYFWLYPPDREADLDDLKAWLDSGHLAVISVDAAQYSTLDGSDLWINSSYDGNVPRNHANTVVGYDDNFGPYTENSTTRKGAFKIANSWGTGWSGDHNSDGKYWISYECMKWEIWYTFVFDDRIGYQPELLSIFNMTHNKRGECHLTLGVGSTSSPTATKRFDDWYNDYDGGDNPFPGNRIVFDITDFKNNVTSYYGKNYFLKAYEYGSGTTGKIMEFTVEHYVKYGSPKPAGNASSKDPPVTTTQGSNVYAQLTLSPYAYNVDTNKYYGTIQGAIDAPATLNGHRINASAGPFAENVLVNKRVNITGRGAIYTIIDGGGTGDTVQVTASSANLTALSICKGGSGPSDAGLELSGVKLFNITNCSIYDNAGMDINLLSGSRAWTLNTTFDNSSVGFGDTTSSLTVRWFLHVLVRDAAGKPISGADVNVKDNANGNWERTYRTNAQGLAEWITVTEFVQTSASRTYYSPYEVTVSNETLDAMDFGNDPRLVVLNISRFVTFDEIPEMELMAIPVAAASVLVVFSLMRKRRK